MEEQIGTEVYWSNQKEPKQEKSKDEVIRRKFDWGSHFRDYSSTLKPIQAQPTYSKINK